MTHTSHNLCLHYLDPSGRRRLALTPSELRWVIEHRITQGQTKASLTRYLHAPPTASEFTLSFDDAHASVLRYAAPILAEYDLQGALFVPTGIVGTSDEFLTWDDLRALRDLGWTLGSHTVHHPRMSWRVYDEDPERYAQRLKEECVISRETLERELGMPVELFAYPYGEAPPEAREAVRAAGYRLAFTVRDELSWDSDVLLIPRVDGMPHTVVSGEVPLPISVVVPACDRVEILSEVIGRLCAQSYPSFEVLVVNDGSREELSEALRFAGPRLRVIDGGGTPGVFGAGMARQRGAELAQHEIIAFLDADIAVGRDYLWHIEWVHTRVPRAVLLGYLSGYNLHDLGHRHTLAGLRNLNDLDAELAVIPDRSREPTLRRCLDNLDWLSEPWRLSYTGNLSLSKSLLSEVGGFSRDFSGWGLEDIDLGLRLSKLSVQWVFSRFAVGYHLLDPDEPSARNPFRREDPCLSDFDGYLANLERLREKHPGDEAVKSFCEHSLGDVRETVSRPDTVGIELGVGVPLYEALDRLAYARKVGARRLYLFGRGLPEHPDFGVIVREAEALGISRFTLELRAGDRGARGSLAAAKHAGLDSVVLAKGKSPADEAQRRELADELSRSGLKVTLA